MHKSGGFFGRIDDSTRDPRLNPVKPTVVPQPVPSPLLQQVASPKPDRADTSATPANDSSIGNRLIVGPDVKLKGAEIVDCDTLIVEGRVEATLDSRIIRIAEKGAFSGTVSIDTAEIHGNFDGELTARSQLFIHATGHVSGKIRYGKILIEEGGRISGDVQSIAASESPQMTAAKPKSAIALT